MGAIISALAASLFSLVTSALTWLLQAVVLKFIVFIVLYFIVQEFSVLLFSLIPQFNIDSLMGTITSGGAYFIDLFKIDEGINLILAAYTTRFAIRRIPVIG